LTQLYDQNDSAPNAIKNPLVLAVENYPFVDHNVAGLGFTNDDGETIDLGQVQKSEFFIKGTQALERQQQQNPDQPLTYPEIDRTLKNVELATQATTNGPGINDNTLNKILKSGNVVVNGVDLESQDSTDLSLPDVDQESKGLAGEDDFKRPNFPSLGDVVDKLDQDKIDAGSLSIKERINSEFKERKLPSIFNAAKEINSKGQLKSTNKLIEDKRSVIFDGLENKESDFSPSSIVINVDRQKINDNGTIVGKNNRNVFVPKYYFGTKNIENPNSEKKPLTKAEAEKMYIDTKLFVFNMNKPKELTIKTVIFDIDINNNFTRNNLKRGVDRYFKTLKAIEEKEGVQSEDKKRQLARVMGTPVHFVNLKNTEKTITVSAAEATDEMFVNSRPRVLKRNMPFSQQKDYKLIAENNGLTGSDNVIEQLAAWNVTRGVDGMDFIIKVLQKEAAQKGFFKTLHE